MSLPLSSTCFSQLHSFISFFPLAYLLVLNVSLPLVIATSFSNDLISSRMVPSLGSSFSKLLGSPKAIVFPYKIWNQFIRSLEILAVILIGLVMNYIAIWGAESHIVPRVICIQMQTLHIWKSTVETNRTPSFHFVIVHLCPRLEAPQVQGHCLSRSWAELGTRHRMNTHKCFSNEWREARAIRNTHAIRNSQHTYTSTSLWQKSSPWMKLTVKCFDGAKDCPVRGHLKERFELICLEFQQLEGWIHTAPDLT